MEKLKRGLAIVGVIILVGLYIATLILAVIGSGYFVRMFWASVAATIALPIMLHLFLSLHNLKRGKSTLDNPYSYRDDK